jgi:sec-independent protein translocase protein TatC
MDSSEEEQGARAPEVGSASSRLTPAAAIDKVRGRFSGGRNSPPGLPPPSDPEDEEDEGMLRMSFLEHLEELRTRIFRMLIGVAVAFTASLTFSGPLWSFVQRPAVSALRALHFRDHLVMIEPMEGFNIIWFKLPLVCSLFLGSPWVVYQVWAFISPGLYRKERRWAAPFILCSAGLFIAGGLFAYFVVFRFGLTFLLSIGQTEGVEPVITIERYFDLFVNVILGVGVVFELPVLIFFLTLLRIVTPSFLLRHSRYAILIIFIIAAVITPTPDVVNLMLFAMPMCMLFYVGIFAGYLLVLNREQRKFPWKKVLLVLMCVLLILALVLYMAITRNGYKLVPHWPFLIH